MHSALDDLIARLEKAEGPDRELSDDILLACGWIGPPQSARMAGILVPHWKRPHGGGDVPSEMRPHPTASIDAALTLVREGWHGWLWFGVPDPSAFVRRTGIEISAVARTPALALCIAALKARKMETSDG